MNNKHRKQLIIRFNVNQMRMQNLSLLQHACKVGSIYNKKSCIKQISNSHLKRDQIMIPNSNQAIL